MTETVDPRFMEAVAYIFPDAKLTGLPQARDVRLQNDGDGPYIVYWGIPGPIPTDIEIQAALAAIDQQASTPFYHEQFKAMIRRRASAQEKTGDQVGSILTLKTIGE